MSRLHTGLQLPLRLGAALLGVYSLILAVVVLGALVVLSPFALLSIPLAANALVELRIAGTDLCRERLPFRALAVVLAANVWGLTTIVGSSDLWVFQIAAGGFVVVALTTLLVNLVFRTQLSSEEDR